MPCYPYLPGGLRPLRVKGGRPTGPLQKSALAVRARLETRLQTHLHIYLLAFCLAVAANMTASQRSWSILALTLSYSALMLLIWLHLRFPPAQ